MTSNTKYADPIGSYLAGNLGAQKALFAIREGVTDPDYLYAEMKLVLSHNEPERMRGFLRQLQKQFEGVRNV